MAIGGRGAAVPVSGLLVAALLAGCGPVPDAPSGDPSPGRTAPWSVAELTAIATSIRGPAGPLDPVPTEGQEGQGGQSEQLRKLAGQLQVRPAGCADELAAGLDVDPAVRRAVPTVTVRQADGAVSLTLMDGSEASARALGDRAVGGTVFVERDEVERALTSCGEVTLDPGNGTRVTLTRTVDDADVVDADRAYAVRSGLDLLGVARRQVTVSAERGSLIAVASAPELVDAQRVAQQALQQANR